MTVADSNIIIFEPDTVAELYGRVFYGLNYDPETGMLEVESIESGEVISLPVLGDGSTHNYTDYATWLASTKYLGFSWETTLSSNLIMEVA